MFEENYEEFTDEQREVLSRYVTNTSSHVFALRNLPEVIKGALFSRYSRSTVGLRSLLLKEFIGNSEESGFAGIVNDQKESHTQEGQDLAIRKAQNFYDRILDGYGDDSIGELGGAHLAIENVSMLTAKVIEDCRIGGSPLEKSTRYVYFDQTFHNEYLFYREPILMTSAYRDSYIETCNRLFETYRKLIPHLTALFENKMAKESYVSQSAYKAALRAKVLDCLRGILPAGTLTNMGVFGNGRFYEQLIHKMHCSSLAECQDLGKKSYEELSKVIPSFVRRADLHHHTHNSYAEFYESMNMELAMVTAQNMIFPERSQDVGTHLLSYDTEAPYKVAAALLYANSNKSLGNLFQYCKQLPDEEIARILDAGCSSRESRRHKSPRALEHAVFTFELLTDFGIYRDLHRHRMLTQERQLFTCDYGYWTPQEIQGTEMEADYHSAMEIAKSTFDAISKELPEEAQYVVPMAYNVRWYFTLNLRALQWLCELRSQPSGHHSYREVAQEMARQVCEQFPIFERFFKFVDYEGHLLGRLQSEEKQRDKMEKFESDR